MRSHLWCSAFTAVYYTWLIQSSRASLVSTSSFKRDSSLCLRWWRAFFALYWTTHENHLQFCRKVRVNVILVYILITFFLNTCTNISIPFRLQKLVNMLVNLAVYKMLLVNEFFDLTVKNR